MPPTATGCCVWRMGSFSSSMRRFALFLAAFSVCTALAQMPPAPQAEIPTLTLDDAIRLALQRNKNLKVTSYLPGISRANLLVARGAFDPQPSVHPQLRLVPVQHLERPDPDRGPEQGGLLPGRRLRAAACRHPVQYLCEHPGGPGPDRRHPEEFLDVRRLPGDAAAPQGVRPRLPTSSRSASEGAALDLRPDLQIVRDQHDHQRDRGLQQSPPGPRPARVRERRERVGQQAGP